MPVSQHLVLKAIDYQMTLNRVKRKKRVITIASVAMVIILFCLYAFLDPEDPDVGRFFPKCPVKLITGLQCPACGIQRAAHSLLQGDVIGALSHNWFLIFSLGYLFSLIITRNFPFQSPVRKFIWGKPGCILYITLYFAWFIVRNLLSI